MNEDEIVYRDGEFMILETVRVLGRGFNVYKEDDKKEFWLKQNPQMSWFGSFDGAKNFLDILKTGSNIPENIEGLTTINVRNVNDMKGFLDQASNNLNAGEENE